MTVSRMVNASNVEIARMSLLRIVVSTARPSALQPDERRSPARNRYRAQF